MIENKKLSNHEVTLKFHTKAEMDRAIRHIQLRFDCKVTNISDYTIYKWGEVGEEYDD